MAVESGELELVPDDGEGGEVGAAGHKLAGRLYPHMGVIQDGVVAFAGVAIGPGLDNGAVAFELDGDAGSGIEPHALDGTRGWGEGGNGDQSRGRDSARPSRLLREQEIANEE